MELPLDSITPVTIVACLAVAWATTRPDKNPVLMLLGLMLVPAAVVVRLVSGAGAGAALVGLFVDVGIGLVLASGLLGFRKVSPRPFFLLGILALALGLLIQGGLEFLRSNVVASENTLSGEVSLLLEIGPDDRIEELAPTLERYDARYEQAFPNVTLSEDVDLAQVFLVYVDPAEVGGLTADLRRDTENVDHVARNETVRLEPPIAAGEAVTGERGPALANDPLVDSQWALEAIDGHEAHRLLSNLSPKRKALVAILDTGVDEAHEDIRDVVGKAPEGGDGNGHGTHCAGIAGAVSNNGIGVASLNWEGRFVDVAGYPALNALGIGTHETIAQAIIDAAEDEADVISMSLGDYAPVPAKVIADAVAYALERGTIVVASAGNADRDAVSHMPSNIDGVIAVAAVDETLRKATFSNTNTSLTRPLAAPGVNVLSLLPGNRYELKSGTSMATPVVSGLIGVLRALNPELTAEQAYDLLHGTGQTLEDSDRVGRLVNAAAAIRAVAATSDSGQQVEWMRAPAGSLSRSSL